MFRISCRMPAACRSISARLCRLPLASKETRHVPSELGMKVMFEG